MAHTTIQDVERLTGHVATDADELRFVSLLPIAERTITRAAGVNWYDAAEPMGDASEDWKLATALLAVAMLHRTGADWQAAAGPFKSASIRGYSFTLKDGAALASATLDSLPDVLALIGAYRVVTVSAFGFALAGPTSRDPVRIEAGEWECDVSRRR